LHTEKIHPKPLTLIGIVSANTLQNSSSYDGMVGYFVKIIYLILKAIDVC
jgi:hypothetical protein